MKLADNMFSLVIASVDKILFQGSVLSVTCPGSEGELTVLPGHIPLVTALSPGFVKIKETTDKEDCVFEITGGVLEVSGEGAVILI